VTRATTIRMPRYPEMLTVMQIARVNHTRDTRLVAALVQRGLDEGRLRSNTHDLLGVGWTEFGQSREDYFDHNEPPVYPIKETPCPAKPNARP